MIKSTEDHTPKRLLSTLRGNVETVPPFWMMRQAGRYLPEYRELRARAGSFLNLCYSPEFACEVTLQPLRRFGMDGAILFSDILVVPDGLGIDVSFVEGEGPKLVPITTSADLPEMDATNFLAYLAPVYDAVSLIKDQVTPATTVLGFAGAPWTVATYMIEGGSSRDFAKTKVWAYGQPDNFQRVIDLLVEATVEHLSAQIKAGVDAVQIFDSWAGVLPERAFRRWCIEPTRKIVGQLKREFPDVPVIGFPRGAGDLYVPYATETGVDAVSLDTGVSPRWARDALPQTCVLQGNLDPRLVVVGGSEMLDEARFIRDAFAGRPFVFNLGHGFVPETPPENVAILSDAIRKWQS